MAHQCPRQTDAAPAATLTRHGFPLWLGLLLVPLLFAATVALEQPAAAAQTHYQDYRGSMRSDSDHPLAGVQFEMARAGGMGLGHKRGGYVGLLARGMGIFSLGVEGSMMWHNHNGQEQRGHQVRIMAGVTALELYDFASWRIELGYVFGERLRGERGYGSIGLGSTISMPLIFGPDGWPLLRAELVYGFAPLKLPLEAFRLEASLSLYPFVGLGGLRPVGFQGGFVWGRDNDEPYHLISFGLIFGAPLR